MKFARLLSIFSLIFFCSSVCSVLAEAPQTPKIVFPLIDSGNSEIYLMNPDGTEQVRLTHNKAFDVSPVWSPTGGQILFTSNRDGVRDLYLMDADGKNVKRVFGKSEDRRHPTWSPDGKM
jgi:Tol biopolymer transport system component